MDLGNDPNGHICRRFSMTLANKFLFQIFFPQQRKPMGSSAQNSSGVHWCRRRVRFNEVPEKVPKVPEKVPGNLGAKPSQVQQGSGESSGEGLGGFGAEPGQVQQGSVPEKVWEASVESQVKFSRVLEKVPEKVWEASVESQVKFNRGSGEGSGEGLGGFGAKPGAKPGSTRFRRRLRRRFREALVQSQVRFSRVPKKVPEKVWEALVQSQARSGSTGFAGF